MSTQFDDIDGVVSSKVASPGIVEIAVEGSGKEFHRYCRRNDIQHDEVKVFAELTLVLVQDV